MRRLRAPSTESLFVATIVLFGFRLGAHPIGDNSMFAHLRTGIDIARGKGIPRADPYSFTAEGEPWVVQSWLASWTYGALHELGGVRLVIVQQALLMALLAWLVVRLARAGTPLRTALAGVIAVGAGAAYWTQRPLLFGLVCLALTVLAVERRWNPWWLVPIGWVWVNTHGSFPLGGAFLVARVAGEWLDDRTTRPPALRYLGTFLVGLAVGAINPLGPKLLTFAAAVGDKREVFRDVTEWRSPNFQRADGVFTLLFLGAALVVLLRTRVAWRHVLPAVGFLAMGLVAMRNIAPAAIVLAPAVGAALRVDRARAERPGGVNAVFAGVLGVAFVVFGAGGVSGDPLNVDGYPVAAVDHLERTGRLAAPHRLAHDEVVGDYLILRYGRSARVFADDRFDMYPLEVSRDLTSLIKADERAVRVLDKWDVDTVLWEDGAPLVALLRATGGWRATYDREGWVVMVRAGT